jgi:hypothetical protein
VLQLVSAVIVTVLANAPQVVIRRAYMLRHRRFT